MCEPMLAWKAKTQKNKPFPTRGKVGNEVERKCCVRDKVLLHTEWDGYNFFKKDNN